MSPKLFLVNLASMIVQYYDYAMLGLAAPVISKYFFPNVNLAEGTFYTFLLITISYIAKPIGAIFLGKIGDIHGRNVAINISIIVTAMASFLIAIIPQYESIGFGAVILLLIYRMLIVACVSSGTDGIRIFVYEKIGSSKQCLGIGMVVASTMIGALLSNLVLTESIRVDSSYSWRIPFIIGSIIGVILLIVRLFTDRNSYNYISQEAEYTKHLNSGIITLIRKNLRLFLLCFIIAGTIGSTYQFYIVFLGAYNSTILGIINFAQMSSYRSIAIFAYIIGAVIGGFTADRLGKVVTHIIGVISLVFILVTMIINLQYSIFKVELYIFGAFIAPFAVITPMIILKSSISPVIRYRIFSFAHAIGSIFISGTTTSVASYIYNKSNIIWMPILFFMFILFSLLMSVLILIKIKKY